MSPDLEDLCKSIMCAHSNAPLSQWESEGLCWRERCLADHGKWEGLDRRKNLVTTLRQTVWISGTPVTWHLGSVVPFSCKASGFLWSSILSAQEIELNHLSLSLWNFYVHGLSILFMWISWLGSQLWSKSPWLEFQLCDLSLFIGFFRTSSFLTCKMSTMPTSQGCCKG